MRKDDDLTRVKAAFEAATPAPDPARREAAIALAMRNFEDLAREKRSAGPGFFARIKAYDPRALLGAATALAALSLLAIAPEWQQRPVPTQGPMPAALSEPEAAPVEGRAHLSAPLADAPRIEPAPEDDRGRKDVISSLRGEVARARESAAVEPSADAGSYARVRSYLIAGEMPPPEAVQVDEIVNAFGYDHLAPHSMHVMPSPWTPQSWLVIVGLQGRAVGSEPLSSDMSAGVTAMTRIDLLVDPAVSPDDTQLQAHDMAVFPAGQSRVVVFELPETAAEGALGMLRLHVAPPGSGSGTIVEIPVETRSQQATPEDRFAVAIWGFARLLRGDISLDDWTYDAAIALATDALGEDVQGHRAEAVHLMRLARQIDMK